VLAYKDSVRTSYLFSVQFDQLNHTVIDSYSADALYSADVYVGTHVRIGLVHGNFPTGHAVCLK